MNSIVMEEQIKILEYSINDNKNKYTNQRKYMFRLVKWYKYPLVILSALSTVILGLQIGDEWIQWQKNIALIVMAAITLLTTLFTFWNIEEYWLQNKVIEQQLDVLRQKFAYEKAKGLTTESIDALFGELQSIIGQQHSYWQSALDDKVEVNSD